MSVRPIPCTGHRPAKPEAGIAAVFRMERALAVGEAAQRLERDQRVSEHLPHAVLWGGATGAIGINVAVHGAEAALAATHLSPLVAIAAIGGAVAMALAQVSMTLVPSFYDRRDNSDVPTAATLEGLSRTVRDSAKRVSGLELAWLAARCQAVLENLGYVQSAAKQRGFNRLRDMPAVNVLRRVAGELERCPAKQRDEAIAMLDVYGGRGDASQLSSEGRALVERATTAAIAISQENARDQT